MIEPQFQAGDLVRLQFVSTGAAGPFKDVLVRDGPTGIYEVVTVLSAPYGQPKYRIKRRDGTPDKVVRESELIPAVRRLRPRPPHGGSAQATAG
jgi:hypothetical protein